MGENFNIFLLRTYNNIFYQSIDYYYCIIEKAIGRVVLCRRCNKTNQKTKQNIRIQIKNEVKAGLTAKSR